MATKLYVGGLPYSVTNEELENLFASFGTVSSAQGIMDRETGRSKGFGFVEMEDDSAAQTAVGELNGKDYQGRTLTVNEARPMEKREPRSGGGGYGGGGGGGSRGGDRRGNDRRDSGRRY